MKLRSIHTTSSCMTKTYKRGPEDKILEIDNELKALKNVANELLIDNKIECMKNREAFISLKDHKENFENNPKHRNCKCKPMEKHTK